MTQHEGERLAERSTDDLWEAVFNKALGNTYWQHLGLLSFLNTYNLRRT